VHPKSILLLPLFIGEPKPLPFELILKNTVLFDETAGDGLLMAVKPAGQGNYQEVERLYDMGHCTNRLSVILFNNNIIRLVQFFAPYAVFIDNDTEVLPSILGIGLKMSVATYTLCVPKIRNTVISKRSWYLCSCGQPLVGVAKAA